MASSIQDIIKSTIGDGARGTKFNFILQFLDSSDAPTQAQQLVLVKSASFPAKGHEVIGFKYKGREIPIRGQIKYNHTWDCVFYLPEDHKIKNIFETWIENLDETNHYDNSFSSKSYQSYVKDFELFQQDFTDTVHTAKYTLKNCFPTEVHNIDVDSNGPGEVLTVSVTFSYSHYTMESYSLPELSSMTNGGLLSGAFAGLSFADKLKNFGRNTLATALLGPNSTIMRLANVNSAQSALALAGISNLSFGSIRSAFSKPGGMTNLLKQTNLQNLSSNISSELTNLKNNVTGLFNASSNMDFTKMLDNVTVGGLLGGLGGLSSSSVSAQSMSPFVEALRGLQQSENGTNIGGASNFNLQSLLGGLI